MPDNDSHALFARSLRYCIGSARSTLPGHPSKDGMALEDFLNLVSLDIVECFHPEIHQISSLALETSSDRVSNLESRIFQSLHLSFILWSFTRTSPHASDERLPLLSLASIHSRALYLSANLFRLESSSCISRAQVTRQPLCGKVL